MAITPSRCLLLISDSGIYVNGLRRMERPVEPVGCYILGCYELLVECEEAVLRHHTQRDRELFQ